jgi:hypothetical protein
MPDTSTEPAYYQLADATVRPGDIVRLSPNLLPLKVVVHVGAEQQTKSGPTVKLLGAPNAPQPHRDILEGKRETKIVVPAQFTWAVLLTRGCDVENGRHRQVAAIRPLSMIQGEEEQIAVIKGEHTSLHYVPPATLDGNPCFPESFVDFRYTMLMHSDLFAQLARPIALTREGLHDLYFGWLRHTMGPQVEKTKPCASCGADVPVFQLVEEALRPLPDY